MPEFVMRIPIVPVPQKRHRSRVVHVPGKMGYVHTYKATKDRNEESNLRSMIHLQITTREPGDIFPLRCAVKIQIIARLPIPTSMSKKERVLSLEQRHTKKPDCDNLAKAILDCCRGVLFVDDRQVWKMTIAKVYSENPEWEVSVEW